MVMPSRARRRMTASTSLTMVGSSAEVGSSNNRMSGCIDRQRAMATRCFCPPESSCGKASAFSARPTSLSRSMPALAAAPAERPSKRTGPMVRFSRTVRWANRLKDWNTMPMRRRRAGTSASGARMSWPSMKMRPPLGWSSRLRQRRKVLLPVPDGPMMEITSPTAISALISFSTSSSPNFLDRCSTRIMVNLFGGGMRGGFGWARC